METYIGIEVKIIQPLRYYLSRERERERERVNASLLEGAKREARGQLFSLPLTLYLIVHYIPFTCKL